MNKVLNIVLWSLLGLSVLVLLGFVSHSKNDRLCKGININIDPSSGNFFVNEDDITDMVFHELDSVVGKEIANIPSEKLEFKIKNHPSIANAEAYKTIDGYLNIEVEQRNPIVRVFNLKGESFYIDNTGKLMPPSASYTSRVLIANGFIFDSYAALSQENARKVSDSIRNRTYIDDIFSFADYISANKFWAAQIEQLYVNKDFEIELIPRVGNHRIVFGDAVSLEEKFEKLKVFYIKGLNKTGWNEYSIINLKYADQVVCTKR